jgi:hypothetical protein
MYIITGVLEASASAMRTAAKPLCGRIVTAPSIEPASRQLQCGYNRGRGAY